MTDFINLNEIPEDILIAYNVENISFQLDNEVVITNWLLDIVKTEKKQLDGITYIFCDDEYLHKINVEYLNHDTYTDIITFQYAESPIEGDMFISVERVRENAAQYNVSFEQELHRVMAHGVLHLCGYKDKSEKDELLMRQKEDTYLALLQL